MRCSALSLLTGTILWAAATSVFAQTTAPTPSIYAKLRDETNRNVVTIISGNPNGGFLYTAHDIAAVLERTSDIRVMPIVGKGGAQNVKDVLYLKGIDMGIMHPHVIKYFTQTGEAGPEINKRVAYITTLFTDELHLVVRPEIQSFADLNGKKINFSNAGSGTQISMRLIFKALGMKVEEVNMGQTDAFELMKRGDIVATTCTCAKPLRSVRGLTKESGLKLLAVPYTKELEDTFLPGVLTHQDYPELIPEGQTINTIAVQTILGVYNWRTKTNERYLRVANFVDTFFDKIDEFRKPPRQPKWKSINIAARVKGLTRFPPAAAWIARNAKLAQSSGSGLRIDRRLARRQAARAAPASPAEQEKLFRQFLKWVQRQPKKN